MDLMYIMSKLAEKYGLYFSEIIDKLKWFDGDGKDLLRALNREEKLMKRNKHGGRPNRVDFYVQEFLENVDNPLLMKITMKWMNQELSERSIYQIKAKLREIGICIK